VTTSLARLLPLAMIVLLATALPTSIGGWGPREGVAAWLFAAAGMGASQGIATATVYGVMVFVASLPGSVLLTATLIRRGRTDRRPQAASVDRLVPIPRSGDRPQPVVVTGRSERSVSV
jgi:hypothetical protein